MNDREWKAQKCQNREERKHHHRSLVPRVVDELVESCSREGCFDHVGPDPIPSRDDVVDIVQRALKMLYPGYFLPTKLDEFNLPYYYGQEATAFFDILSRQIGLSLRHDCLRNDLECLNCEERGEEEALRFMQQLPPLRHILATDVRAAYEGDPAAGSYDEIIFSYPGLFAVTVYRIAHLLHERKIPLMPRIMCEYAHSITGIDIHPGAEIGESFFIDHGTGLVIGATTVIGRRVRIYQGVTLGALSLPKDGVQQLRTHKRHPTIEDDVIIYSGATILGGETVIGARSVIGGNVWLTESVPPDMKVFMKKPELVYVGPKKEGQQGEGPR